AISGRWTSIWRGRRPRIAVIRLARPGVWVDVVGSIGCTSVPRGGLQPEGHRGSACAPRGPALGGPIGGRRLPLDDVAAHYAAERERAGAELDARAAPAAGGRLVAEGACQLLEVLAQYERDGFGADARLPGAGHGGGDEPEVQPVLAAAAAHWLHAVGLPVAHVEVVRDHARTRRELAHELGTQPQVHVLAEIERHHGGSGEVGLEEILPEECHLRGDAGGQRRVAAEAHQLWIDLHPDAPRAEIAGGGDHHASVAAAEVEDDVVRNDAGNLQHLEADILRRGDEWRVWPREMLAKHRAAGDASGQREREQSAPSMHR